MPPDVFDLNSETATEPASAHTKGRQATDSRPRALSASLVVASLEIGKVLAGRDGVTFRAQGTCMYPTVREGDVLRIRPCPATEVSVGDIAVCRGNGFLFSHRVIATGSREGRAYIITRPDRSRHGSDGPTFDENLLGIVVTLTRRGTPVPLTPTRYPLPVRWYYAARLAWIETRFHLLRASVPILLRIQKHPIYSFFARRILALQRQRISYRIRIPHAALGDAAYRCFTPDSFDLEKQTKDQRCSTWTLTLHLDEDRDPAAWMTLHRDTENVWQVKEIQIRQRYRGMGLDERLAVQARRLCEKASVSVTMRGWPP